MIEQARLQLHLVALNTNFYSEVNHATAENDEMDPGGQWAWLETILLKARRRRGTVCKQRHLLVELSNVHVHVSLLYSWRSRVSFMLLYPVCFINLIRRQ